MLKQEMLCEKSQSSSELRKRMFSCPVSIQIRDQDHLEVHYSDSQGTISTCFSSHQARRQPLDVLLRINMAISTSIKISSFTKFSLLLEFPNATPLRREKGTEPQETTLARFSESQEFSTP